MKRSIIIDTDPGIDDAVAIGAALFSPGLEVKLITTVSGNANIDKVTDNALKLLTFWQKRIPVAKGAGEPLLREKMHAEFVHGESGMDGYTFTEIDRSLLLKEHAVEAMRNVILEEDAVTIVPIGPLTNIALLLKLYPEVKGHIREIVLMGGSTGRGNRGIYAEFNIEADPEAAKIVFGSGLNLVMAPLDVGRKALLYQKDSDRLKTFNKTGEMLASLLLHYRGNDLERGMNMYDSCAIAYLVKPDLFTSVKAYVDIELCGVLTAGATVTDWKGILGKKENTTVLTDIDSRGFVKWLLDTLKQA